MTAIDKEWIEKMTFKPDAEIEKELVSLRTLLSLGKISDERYRMEYHKAALRKQASTQI